MGFRSRRVLWREKYTLSGTTPPATFYENCAQRFGPALFAELCITGETYFCICCHFLPYLIYLFIYLFIHLYIYLFIYLSNYLFIYLYMYVCMCVCMYVCMYVFIYLFIYLSIYFYSIFIFS